MFYCLDRLCDDIFNYADGNTLSEVYYDINVVNKLEVASCQAVAWFEDNFMQVNVNKFQVSIMSRDPTNTDIALLINNVNLKSAELVKKLLGAQICNKLNFHHIYPIYVEEQVINFVHCQDFQVS